MQLVHHRQNGPCPCKLGSSLVDALVRLRQQTLIAENEQPPHSSEAPRIAFRVYLGTWTKKAGELTSFSNKRGDCCIWNKLSRGLTHKATKPLLCLNKIVVDASIHHPHLLPYRKSYPERPRKNIHSGLILRTDVREPMCATPLLSLYSTSHIRRTRVYRIHSPGTRMICVDVCACVCELRPHNGGEQRGD